MKSFLIVLLVSTVSVSAQTTTIAKATPDRPVVGTGPFGLPMGATLSQLEGLGVKKDATREGFYGLARVPKPHPAFESYFIVYTEKFGLCKITAIGKDIDTNGYGTEVKSAFDALSTALSAKYGDPTGAHDFLSAGSIWDEPKDWMMGLLKKDRILSSFWFASAQKPMPDHVAAISLEASGLHSDVGYLSLSYEFENSSACIDEVKNKRNSVL